MARTRQALASATEVAPPIAPPSVDGRFKGAMDTQPLWVMRRTEAIHLDLAETQHEIVLDCDFGRVRTALAVEPATELVLPLLWTRKEALLALDVSASSGEPTFVVPRGRVTSAIVTTVIDFVQKCGLSEMIPRALVEDIVHSPAKDDAALQSAVGRLLWPNPTRTCTAEQADSLIRLLHLVNSHRVIAITTTGTMNLDQIRISYREPHSPASSDAYNFGARNREAIRQFAASPSIGLRWPARLITLLSLMAQDLADGPRVGGRPRDRLRRPVGLALRPLGEFAQKALYPFFHHHCEPCPIVGTPTYRVTARAGDDADLVASRLVLGLPELDHETTPSAGVHQMTVHSLEGDDPDLDFWDRMQFVNVRMRVRPVSPVVSRTGLAWALLNSLFAFLVYFHMPPSVSNPSALDAAIGLVAAFVALPVIWLTRDGESGITTHVLRAPRTVLTLLAFGSFWMSWNLWFASLVGMGGRATANAEGPLPLRVLPAGARSVLNDHALSFWYASATSALLAMLVLMTVYAFGVYIGRRLSRWPILRENARAAEVQADRPQSAPSGPVDLDLDWKTIERAARALADAEADVDLDPLRRRRARADLAGCAGVLHLLAEEFKVAPGEARSASDLFLRCCRIALEEKPEPHLSPPYGEMNIGTRLLLACEAVEHSLNRRLQRTSSLPDADSPGEQLIRLLGPRVQFLAFIPEFARRQQPPSIGYDSGVDLIRPVRKSS